MSIREETQEVLDDMLSEENFGEHIFTPSGQKVLAIVTNATQESEFIPGMELIENSIQARVSRTYLSEIPKLQEVWIIRGEPKRLVKISSYPSSFLLSFEDSKV